jgi:hypothetical protein
MTFVRGKPRPPNSGRRKGVRNKRTVVVKERIYPDALAFLAKVVRGRRSRMNRNGVLVVDYTDDQKLRAAAALAQYQRPKPTTSRSETFIGPVDYQKPRSVEEARETILVLGERLARKELSVEAHDALVGGLKTYLGDRAAEQQRELDRLKEDLGMNVGHP